MRSVGPTPLALDAFRTATRRAFAFLLECGFVDAPIPQQDFVNPYQVRFSNGKLIVAVEGINGGQGVSAHLEDLKGTTVPLVLFVPPECKKPRQLMRRVDADQAAQIQLEAQYLKDHCADLLQGDMTRFQNRVAEWRRIMNRDRSYQKRELP